MTGGSEMLAGAPRAGVAALLGEERPDAVFHLAAQIDVRHAVADPAFDAAVNVGGTAVLLEAARAAGTRRFVLASTGGAIYGDTDRLPTPEDCPSAPISPYGASKAAAETYLALYARLHGLSTVSLRFANVYGPRQDPLGEGGVIAIYCHAAANGRRVRVFGDGPNRDFVYVGDVAAALIGSADREVDRRLQRRHGGGDGRARAGRAPGARADLRARAAGRDPALLPGPERRAGGVRLGAGDGARRRASAHAGRLGTTKGRRSAPSPVENLVRLGGPAADDLAMLRWSPGRAGEVGALATVDPVARPVARIDLVVALAGPDVVSAGAGADDVVVAAGVDAVLPLPPLTVSLPDPVLIVYCRCRPLAR